jgi:hypothetical protein
VTKKTANAVRRQKRKILIIISASKYQLIKTVKDDLPWHGVV